MDDKDTQAQNDSQTDFDSGTPATPPPADTMPPQAPDIQPVNQSAGAQIPAIDPLGTQAQTQPQAPAKHSLWRAVLAGALTGMARGAIANAPVTQAEDRHDLIRQQIAESQARTQQEQQRLQLQQQQQDLEQQKFQFTRSQFDSEADYRKAQLAMLQVQGAIAQRQLALLPTDSQDAFIQNLRKLAADLVDKGAEQVAQFGSSNNSQANFFAARDYALAQKKQNNSFAYVTMPSIEGGQTSWTVYKLPETKLSQDAMVDLGSGKKISVPAGTPVQDYALIQSNLLLHQIEEDSANFRANLEAQSKVESAKILAGAKESVAAQRGANLGVVANYDRQISQQQDTLTKLQMGLDKAKGLGILPQNATQKDLLAAIADKQKRILELKQARERAAQRSGVSGKSVFGNAAAPLSSSDAELLNRILNAPISPR